MRTVRLKGGYGNLQLVVMRSDQISQHGKLVYGLFIAYSGTGGSCFPSITTICKDLKMGRGTVVEAIKDLEAIGLLEKESRYKKDGSKSSNVYYPMHVIEGSSVLEPHAVSTENEPSSPPEPQAVSSENPNNNTFNINNEQHSVNSNELTGVEYLEFEMMEPEAKNQRENAPPKPPQQKSTYVKMTEAYFTWYKGRNNDTDPKFDGGDGNALKQIVRYFEGIARQKLQIENQELTPENISDRACRMFQWTLGQWDFLEPFLQKQVKITQISSNLTNIINDLKNGRKNRTPQQQKADRAGTIAEGFAGIDEAFREQG
jgi:GntR family transcriptional regulator